MASRAPAEGRSGIEHPGRTSAQGGRATEGDVDARRATDAEVDTWRRDGWVLMPGLLSTDEVDAAAADLAELFPSAADYHADPDGVTERWLGRPAPAHDVYTWPADGPGFRPDQHVWRGDFPFPGGGVLNRLCVHPAIVDFAERALDTRDIRLYQAAASAKYGGLTNYEQPMHADRNHSWLPAVRDPRWWNLQTFVYLSDIGDDQAPTHLVTVGDAGERHTTVWGVMPAQDAELYAAERPAPGPRGSVLAYRSNVFHRGVDIRDPRGARFFLALSFKVAGHDWIGFAGGMQSVATSFDWIAFVEQSTPRELELFGFPPPGHPIWDEDLLALTAEQYPKLDLSPWRRT